MGRRSAGAGLVVRVTAVVESDVSARFDEKARSMQRMQPQKRRHCGGNVDQNRRRLRTIGTAVRALSGSVRRFAASSLTRARRTLRAA
jgi:hypothetical protein